VVLAAASHAAWVADEYLVGDRRVEDDAQDPVRLAGLPRSARGKLRVPAADVNWAQLAELLVAELRDYVDADDVLVVIAGARTKVGALRDRSTPTTSGSVQLDRDQRCRDSLNP
jgi:hypothetical protein